MKEGYLRRFVEAGKVESQIFYDIRKHVQVEGAQRGFRVKKCKSSRGYASFYSYILLALGFFLHGRY